MADHQALGPRLWTKMMMTMTMMRYHSVGPMSLRLLQCKCVIAVFIRTLHDGGMLETYSGSVCENLLGSPKVVEETV